jgi:hypothetical protein
MNANVELIEYVILAIILGAQFLIFYQTWSRIQIFKSIIPNLGYKIKGVCIPKEHLSWNPEDVLKTYNNSTFEEQYSIYNNDENQLTLERDGLVKLNFISLNTLNPIGLKIEKSINHYLIRNYQATTDFNLIKDVVERHVNSSEENISQSVSVPLYLGLMGTMIGIVIGLFNMPKINVSDTELKFLDMGITNLISGVKIAMIASFVGLFLTVLNSAWLFKLAKREAEELKNDFYTFIQVNLLPTINNGMASTFESLQRNLIRFNEEFGSNLGDLKDVFTSSKQNIREQANLIRTIENTKLSEIVRFNVTVLKQLDKSVNEFEKFNHYLTNVNEFVHNSQLIVGKTNELLDRTDNFNVIAENLSSRLEQSERLLQFLNIYFTDLESLKDTTKTGIVDVSFSVVDTFKELQNQIQKLSEDVTKFTVNEAEILKDALSSGSNFKKLDKLEHLSKIENEFSSFKKQSAEQTREIKNSFDSLNNNILGLVKALKSGNVQIGEISNPSSKNVFTRSWHYITSFFSRKKK